MSAPKVIVFTCNWDGYAGLESAGINHLEAPPGIHPLKVMCLGEISSGILLKSFEKGADGVLLMGCPPDGCHYEFGNRCAEDVVSESRELLKIMGYREEQLQLDWIGIDEPESYVEKIRNFISGLNGSHD